MNPYESPLSISKSRKSPRRTVAPFVVAAVGIGLLVASGYNFYLAARLEVDYPGLSDPSPNVDAYWPNVVHQIYMVFGTFLGIVGVACGVTTLVLIYSADGTEKSSSKEPPPRNAQSS